MDRADTTHAHLLSRMCVHAELRIASTKEKKREKEKEGRKEGKRRRKQSGGREKFVTAKRNGGL